MTQKLLQTLECRVSSVDTQTEDVLLMGEDVENQGDDEEVDETNMIADNIHDEVADPGLKDQKKGNRCEISTYYDHLILSPYERFPSITICNTNL